MLNTALALKDPPAREYANALAAGTVLMEYRLERVLGAGGFGITYLGWDPNLEKHVAIKEYLPAQLAIRALDGSIVPIATEQKYDYFWGLERFVQEARTLARFSHPHIVRVIRYIEANGTAYMVMEYEAGQSLAQWFNVNSQPAEEVLRTIVQPLLDGLEAMHAQGFLHRDIKPANVFMRANETPVLLDFGAARQAVGHKSMSLTSIVSPGYAPLEQYASDGNQGPWTDVYSLSAVLFRAVTGQNPPEAISRIKVDRVSNRLDAAQGRYSATFLKAVALGMAVDERLRPQSVAEWRSVLLGDNTAAPRQAAIPVAVGAKTTVVADALTKQQTRRHAAVVAAGSERSSHVGAEERRWPWVVVGMLAMAIVALFVRGSPPPPARPAPVATERAIAAPASPVAAPAPVAQPLSESSPVTQASQLEIKSAVQERPAPLDADSPRFAGSPPEAEPRKAAEHMKPPSPHLKPLPPKPHPGMMRDFQLADANGDGAITLAEAQARMPRLVREFGRVDANGDGRVTLIELQRFLQQSPERAPRPQ